MTSVIVDMDTFKTLAWYMYPEPKGRPYTAEELNSPAIVEEVFDYCQILLAYITANGWKYLIDVHSIEGLLEINKRSGWFSDESLDEAKEDLVYYCHISGFDPLTNQFGAYDEDEGFVAFK